MFINLHYHVHFYYDGYTFCLKIVFINEKLCYTCILFCHPDNSTDTVKLFQLENFTVK